MFVLTLGRQSCVNPVLLAFSIVPYVYVTQRRQFTGGFLRSISSRLRTVDHDVSRFIWQNRRCELHHLIGRQIDRARQVSMMIGSRWQSLDKYKRLSAINLQFQFVPRNCGYHESSQSLLRGISVVILNVTLRISIDVNQQANLELALNWPLCQRIPIPFTLRRLLALLIS